MASNRRSLLWKGTSPSIGESGSPPESMRICRPKDPAKVVKSKTGPDTVSLVRSMVGVSSAVCPRTTVSPSLMSSSTTDSGATVPSTVYSPPAKSKGRSATPDTGSMMSALPSKRSTLPTTPSV